MTDPLLESLRTMSTAERCDPMWLAVAAHEIERLIERVDELTAAGEALADTLNKVHRYYHVDGCDTCTTWMAWLNTARPVVKP